MSCKENKILKERENERGERLHTLKSELAEILKQNRLTRLQIMLHRAESDLLLVALNHDCIHKLDRVKVGERVAL